MATPARVITAPQGRYEIIRRLAVGGMAEVFLARQLLGQGVERVVVLKRVLPNLLAEPEFIELFLSEGRLATQLTHPNIVQIFEVGTTTLSDDDGDAGPFMSMEYLEGADLRTLLREAYLRGEKLGVAEAVGIVAQAAHGLGYAHRKAGLDGRPLGVVHRDISPHNLFVTLDGVTKVLDFGIAKSAAQRIVTRKNVMKGKLGYMAPEQLLGRALDRRTDLFAIGIVLWEALTTERLFLFDDDAETARAILRQRPKPPSELNPRVPPELDAIALKLLEHDPAARYQHAEEVAGALERVLHALGCTSPTLMLARRVQALMPGAAAGASPPAPPTGATPRERTSTLAIAGVPDADEDEPGFGDRAVDSLLDDAETTSLTAPPPDADLALEAAATPPRAPPADRTRTALARPPPRPPAADRTRTLAASPPPPVERGQAAAAAPLATVDATRAGIGPAPVEHTRTRTASVPVIAVGYAPSAGPPPASEWVPTESITSPGASPYAPALPARPSTLTLALLGALAGLAALAVAWLVVGAAPRAVAPSHAAVNAPASVVSVRIGNAPAGARARLDGVDVPLAFVLPRGAAPRRLELLVGADVVAALAIVPDRDVHIEFPPARPAAQDVAPSAGPSAAPPPPPAPRRPTVPPSGAATGSARTTGAPRTQPRVPAAPPDQRTGPHRPGTLGHEVSREYP